MEFSDWITSKFVEWRGNKIGHDGTIEKFSSEIGVGRSLVSQWMQKGGKVPTSKKAIDGLVRLFGNEVYEVLKIQLPTDDQLSDLATALQAIPEDKRDAARKQLIDMAWKIAREVTK